MIGDVGDHPADIQSFGRQARGLGIDGAGIDIDERHARAVCGEYLAVCEAKTARAARDDHAEPGHVELRRNVHAPYLL